MVPDDQLSSLLEWLGQRSTTILKEINDEHEATQQSQSLYIDNEEAEDGPIPRFIHKTLSDALNAGASDIHFEFYEQMARVRFRVDGQLREVVQPPVAVRGQLASRIKVMARLDISENVFRKTVEFKLPSINTAVRLTSVSALCRHCLAKKW